MEVHRIRKKQKLLFITGLGWTLWAGNLLAQDSTLDIVDSQPSYSPGILI